VFSIGYERIKKRKERSPPQDDYLFDIIEAEHKRLETNVIATVFLNIFKDLR